MRGERLGGFIVRKGFATYLLIEITQMTVLLFYFWTRGSVSIDNVASAERFIGLWALINIVSYFIYYHRASDEWISVANLFVVFLYLFNLGIPISRFLGWIDDSTEAFLSRRVYPMGYSLSIEYCVYCFLIISMLQVGIMYYMNHNIKTKEARDEYESDGEVYEYQLAVCVKIGKILMVLTAIPYIYQEYMYLKNSMIYGYQNPENTFSLAGTGIGLISGLFVVGIIMLLIGYQKRTKVFNWIFVIAFVYQIIRMLISGDRSTGLVLILVWLLIRQRYVKPITGKHIPIYLVGIYVAMLGLKLIEMTRSINSASASEVLTELFQKNMLVETINEYGGNVWSGLMVFYSVPATGGFRYGLMYLAAIVGKPLSILGITNDVWYYADFSRFLNESGRGELISSLTGAMGGSFTGEWWFNFGWVGIILIPFFGYFLAKFSDACENRAYNPVLSGYLLYVATMVIWWVRQYCTSVSWNAMVYGVVVLILYQIIMARKRGGFGIHEE